MEYNDFCARAGKAHDKINTVVVIANRAVGGAWARPGQFIPDQKMIEKLLLQVDILISIAKTNTDPYGEVGYVMVTHKKADFFFSPAGNQRILLVSIDRPYDHGALEDKLKDLLKELNG